MADVVSVSFRMGPHPYYFDPGELELPLGTLVVAETIKGIEIGRVVVAKHTVRDDRIPQPLKPLLRLATEVDVRRDSGNRNREALAREVCVKKIREHDLPMRLVNVIYTLDGSRVVFHFTAEGRVDFRDLVRDLARAFRTRIEMHQVGVRDQSRMIGGMSTCGRPLCCASFLSDFQPVAIRMAKEQGLSLNPVKISGMCGRLMCCLRYEYDTYRELRKAMPRIGSTVETPLGPGTVIGHELLREMVEVEFPESDDEDQVELDENPTWFRLAELLPTPPPKRRPRRDRRRRRRIRRPRAQA